MLVVTGVLGRAFVMSATTLALAVRRWCLGGSSDWGDCQVYESVGLISCEEASLSDDNAPALVLWERLGSQGWRAGLKATDEHTDAQQRILCVDLGLADRAAYARCLLQLPALFQSGLTRLHAGERVCYYQAVLKCQDKSGIVPGLTVQRYQELVKDPAADDLTAAPADEPMEEAEEGVILPTVPARLARKTRSRPASSSHDPLEEEEGYQITLGPLQILSCPEAEAGAGASGSAAEAVAPGAWEPYLLEMEASDFPWTVEGVKLIFNQCLAPRKQEPYVRLRAVCPNPDHHGCYRNRNVNLGGRRGARGVVGFLGCWLHHAPRFSSRVEHMAFRPDPDEVDSYCERNSL